MTNFDLITSTEYKYLIYLCDELKKVHNYFIKCASDRDVKLSLILRDDFCNGYDSAIETISKIKEQINNLDVYQLASAELEEIGRLINNLIEYYEYFEGLTKTVNSI